MKILIAPHPFMKNIKFIFTGIIFGIIFCVNPAMAQKPANAGDYMQEISTEYSKITKDCWSYTSAVAHGKRARKLENRRKELVGTITATKKKISGMPGWQGDKSYRDSVVSFLKVYYDVINNEYSNITNIEGDAEQSYEKMEAYLLAQEKAGERLDNVYEMMKEQQAIFAAAHEVTLLQNSSKVSGKLERADRVFNYYHPLYLIFFRSYKQESFLLNSILKKDIPGMEQNREGLVTTASNGLSLMEAQSDFDGDASLKNICIEMLSFYKSETENNIGELISYFKKQEDFKKIKKEYDAKLPAKRTKADAEQYNNAANEVNAASVKYNSTNLELNTKRAALLEKWNQTVSDFLDKHVPK